MTARRDDYGGFRYFQDLFATCSAMMQRIVNLSQPVIAEVKGIATAARCQLVASCDLAVASDNATFARDSSTVSWLVTNSKTQRLGWRASSPMAENMMATDAEAGIGAFAGSELG